MIFLISFGGERMQSLAPCPLLPVLWSEQQCSGANWRSALEIAYSTSRYGFAAGNLKREVISSIFALSLYPCDKCHGVIIDCYQSSYDARSSCACIEINWIENVSTFRGPTIVGWTYFASRVKSSLWGWSGRGRLHLDASFEWGGKTNDSFAWSRGSSYSSKGSPVSANGHDWISYRNVERISW